MKKPKPTNPALPAQGALTLEGLYQHRVNLTAERDQLIANVNAAAGALQMVEKLIGQLEAPAKADTPA